MEHLFAPLVVVLCAAQSALSQEFDCSTTSGQLGFLQKGAESDPGCYNPVINLITSDTAPTPTQIEGVCRDTCAGRMLNFLRSTEECRNDEEVQENAYFLENELCAYKDGEGEPETSCALQSESGIRVTVACLGWWFFGGSQCPALVDGVPVVASSCADALRTVVGEYGCCLQNIFGTEESIEEATQYIIGKIPPGTDIPSDFEVDITDQALYAACGVSLPNMCESQIIPDDCSTTSGQLSFLQKGAENNPGCYSPVINLITSDTAPTPTQIEGVCRDTCAGKMLNFLRSTEECRNDEEVQENAYFLENELCAYKDGEGEPETSCALQSESGIRVTVACLGWWFFGGSQCPALVDGAPVVASSCADALRTVVGEYGCCLQNIFGTEESIEEATQYIVGMIPPGTDIPSDFEVDVTDPALYAACGVSLPQICPSQITSGGPSGTDPTTSTTVTDRTTATSATTGTPSSITLLTALLLALIAKLAGY